MFDGMGAISKSRGNGASQLATIRNVAWLCQMQSYYGGLLCCAWSPDNRYVATGGEDDMVSLFGLVERCVTAWGQGHNSWISRIAFDPWRAPVLNAVTFIRECAAKLWTWSACTCHAKNEVDHICMEVSVEASLCNSDDSMVVSGCAE